MSTRDTIAEIARRIVAARERLGLTQADLGAAAGCAKGTVSRIERGEYVPAIGTLLALAKALGASVSELVGELEPRDRPAPKVSPVARRLHERIDELPVDAQRALLALVELLRADG